MLFVASLVFGVLVLFFLFSLWFANTAWLRITRVSVSGENVIPQTSIETVANDVIASKYLGLYSKANILLYPKSKILRELHTLYPTLQTADIHASDFHTIAITVTERTPHALWCSASSATCVLLDDDGLAYANAPDYSGAVYEKYYGALPDGPLPKQFLTPAEFRSLSALIDAFAKKVAPDTITTIEVDENKDVHVSIAGETGGYKILFALGDNSGSVFERFTIALTAGPFTTHKLSDFEYIDLRFGTKVYYKLKN